MHNVCLECTHFCFPSLPAFVFDPVWAGLDLRAWSFEACAMSADSLGKLSVLIFIMNHSTDIACLNTRHLRLVIVAISRFMFFCFS